MTEERNEKSSKEQQSSGYDAFIIHEFRTGNKLAISIKDGLEAFGITAFVAPQDVPIGANEESTRQSALKNAKEILVIITHGIILRPGEAANELKAVIDAGQVAKIKPYRKKGISSKTAVDFLMKMGITFRMQCPTFDDESEIIDNILSRKGHDDYFPQTGVNAVLSEPTEDIEDKPWLRVTGEIFKILGTRQVKGYGKVPSINSPFDLRIYVNNDGNVNAEHVAVIISLKHFKSHKILRGSNMRIDNMRNGMPSLQWTSGDEIVLSKPAGLAIALWELRLKPDIKWVGTILWEVYAGRMNPVKGELAVVSLPAAQYVLNHGERCFLREYSSIFPPQISEGEST